MTTPLFSASWEDTGVTFYGGGGAACTDAWTFLARTSGLDAAHRAAYGNLICGLVTDGIWTKLDMLHVYATQDTTTAQLNLVSSSFPATLNGSPTFTADRGYTGVNGSSTVYISTGFNSSVGSPKFVKDSAHMSAWSVLNGIGSSSHGVMGTRQGTSNSAIFTNSGGSALFCANSSAFPGFVNANTAGHYIANRTNATDIQGYKNGSNVVTSTPNVSTAIQGLLTVYTLGDNLNGTAEGAADQLAMVSIGSSLSASDATNLYNRLRTYMTAVGVP